MLKRQGAVAVTAAIGTNQGRISEEGVVENDGFLYWGKVTLSSENGSQTYPTRDPITPITVVKQTRQQTR